jgi:hypothetical protein
MLTIELWQQQTKLVRGLGASLPCSYSQTHLLSLFVQPGRRAHGFDFLGGDDGRSPAIGIDTLN